MKESAAGDDEITSNTLRTMARGSHAFRLALCKEIRHLWHTEPTQWEEVVIRGVVFLLWKQKHPKTNLDNYRGICLLTTLSRLLAKIVASRLTIWLEGEDIMPATSYGSDRTGVQGTQAYSSDI